MVEIYKETYDLQELDEFKLFPYELSGFQKHSIKAIIDGDHSLVVASTGSGKSTPAEFAIKHFTSKGKKVIYTSPIKALSNQKYYDFKRMFPEISFGILTGDIQINPDGDVLIMTAEILHNILNNESPPDMPTNARYISGASLENLGCVIFDEIHYINDNDRGYVWEESIMKINPDIQLVMLSATIASPDKFAEWIIHRPFTKNKIIVSISTIRVVPLIHYGFMTCGTLKKVRDKALVKQINADINKIHVIQETGPANMDVINRLNHTLDKLDGLSTMVHSNIVLDRVCDYMNKNNMLPAIIFVFSRKNVVSFAKSLSVSLNLGPINIRKECENILRRLPNFKEFINLPEYDELLKLLNKGIAIHHGGMLAVFREMVEIMFTRGYVKVLFATETFAVGINLPVKTAVFTQISKFTDGEIRQLYSHEYTQMAGRAGRRGIDTVGHAIHLLNMYKYGYHTTVEEKSHILKNVMRGTPQTLTSKFRISYNWVLSNCKDTSCVDHSMMQNELAQLLDYVHNSITEKEHKLATEFSAECLGKLNQHIEIQAAMPSKTKKEQRVLRAELAGVSENKEVKKAIRLYNSIQDLYTEEKRIRFSSQNQIDSIINILTHNGFMKDGLELTPKGILATKIQRLNPLLFAELIVERHFDKLELPIIIGIFSCFTYMKSKNGPTSTGTINMSVIEKKNDYYRKVDMQNKLQTGTDYEINYSLVDDIIAWCHAETEEACRNILYSMDISAGDFVKIILEVNHTIEELQGIAEATGYIDLYSKLQNTPELLLKYIAAPTSLYI